MTVEEALRIVDALLEPNGLSDIQELVFCQVWAGQGYATIAENSGYDTDYIKHVASRLWKLLSKFFGEKVSKSNLRSVLRRRAQQHQGLATPPAMTDINSQPSIENSTKIVLTG